MPNSLTKIIMTALLSLFLVACTTFGDPAKKKKEANLKEASVLNTQLAIGYIQAQKYKPAKDKLDKAIKQNPENFSAYKTLAYLYALLGLTEDADDSYQEALDIKRDDADLSNSYGAFLCSIGQYDKAQEYLKIAYDNPFYEARYLAQSNAGSCLIKQDKYKQAEALLRKSLRTESRLTGSLISMAEIGIKTERYLMARAYIQRYHSIKSASAESLWLQIQAEKALGATKHYMRYARQLINDFPDSDEAGWVEAQASSE